MAVGVFRGEADAAEQLERGRARAPAVERPVRAIVVSAAMPPIVNVPTTSRMDL